MTTTRQPFGQRSRPAVPIRYRPSGWLLVTLPGVVTLFGTHDPEASKALRPTAPAA